MMDCFNIDKFDEKECRGTQQDIIDLSIPIRDDKFDKEAYRNTQPDNIDCYSFLSKDLFYRVVNEGVVRPKFGIHCSLDTSGAYLALYRRFGSKFFVWYDNFWSEWKDDFTDEYYVNKVNEDVSRYVLVKFIIPKEYVMFTNFRNWTDLESIYHENTKDPTEEELNGILDLEFSGLRRSLNQLWSDIFYINKNGHVQLMISEFRKEWIQQYSYVDNSIVAY